MKKRFILKKTHESIIKVIMIFLLLLPVITIQALSPEIYSYESDPTESYPITVYVDFHEEVSGFTSDVLIITNGTLISIYDYGYGYYACSVEPAAEGMVTVSLPAGVIFNSSQETNDSAYFEIEYVTEISACTFYYYGDNSDYSSSMYFDNYENLSSSDSWYWEFGDDSGETNANDPYPVHSFPGAGTYTVCLYATIDNEVCTYCRDVEISESSVIEEGLYVREIETGVYAYMELTSETDSYGYYKIGEYNEGDMENATVIAFGSYYTEVNIIGFYADDESPCQSYGEYYFSNDEGYLYLNMESDECEDRIDLINGYGFYIDEPVCDIGFYTYNEWQTPAVYTFESYGLENVESWSWYFGDGTYDYESVNPVHEYTTDGEYGVWLSAESADGTICSYSSTVWVETEVYCPVSFDYQTSYAQPMVYSFEMWDEYPDSELSSWYWDYGDVSATDFNMYSTIHTFPEEGDYTVCLHVTYEDGTECSTCYDVWVEEQECPAYFWSEAEDSDYPNVITFNFDDADYSSETYTWTWDFGDGNTLSGSEQYPTHTYEGSGEILVTLTLDMDGDVCSNWQTVWIDNTDNCPEFYYTYDTDNSKIIDLYFDESGYYPDASWTWYLDGEEINTGSSEISYEFEEEGVYNICLEIVENNESCYTCQMVYISDYETDCEADINAEINSETLTVTFSNVSEGDFTEYWWYFSDNTESRLKSPQHTFSEAGVYDVWLGVLREDGCWAETNEMIVVGEGNFLEPFFDYEYNTEDDYKITFYDYSVGQSDDAYYWDFGDGETSEGLSEVTYTYANPGFYEVCLTIWNDNGDQAEYCDQIVVGDADVSYDCSNKIITEITDEENYQYKFTGVSEGADEWYWYIDDDVEIYTTKSLEYQFTDEGYHWVCLGSWDNATRCYAETCEEILISSDETYNCEATVTAQVKDQSTMTYQFAVESTNITNYFWEFGDGTYEETTEETITHSFDEAGKYYVYLYAYNEETGCYVEKIKTVEVTDESGTQVVSVAFDYVERDDEVYFKNSSTGVLENVNWCWYWTFGDLQYDTVKSPVHVYDANGYYDVCLKIENVATGSWEKYCEQIQVTSAEEETSEVCNAEFSYYTQGYIVNFVNKSKGNVSEYEWNFGDGTISYEESPSHTFEQGEYFVVLQTYDKTTGCSDMYYEFIQIGEADCKAGFEANVDVENMKVTYNNTSDGDNLTYFWVFDDWDFSEEESPVVYYDTHGMHYAFLLIEDQSSGCWDYYEEDIQVGESGCSAEFTSYAEQLDNDSYEVTLKPVTKNFSSDVIFFWVFGDGDFATVKAPAKTYTKPGLHYVSLSVLDATDDGEYCSDFVEKYIQIGSDVEDIEADFSYKNGTGNLQITFKDKSIGDDLNYSWNFGDNTVDSEQMNLQNPTRTYTTEGFYNVCLYIWNDATENISCKDIKVGEPDLYAKFEYTVDETNKKVTFTNKSVGAASYQWDFDDDNTSTEQNPVHTYSDTGLYMIHLRVEDETGTDYRDAYKYINVGAASRGLGAAFAYNVDESKRKSGGYPSDFIGASFGEPAKAVWDFGDCDTNPDDCKDSTSTTPTHVYQQPGTYTVCYTISDPVTGEESTTCQEVVISDVTAINNINSFNESLSAYPNPVSGKASVAYKLATDSEIELSVFDIVGKKVAILEIGKKTSGEHTIEWNTAILNSGVYYIKLRTAQNTYTRKIVVKK